MGWKKDNLLWGSYGRALPAQVGLHLDGGERIEAEICEAIAACEAALANRA
jgi:hypothetical protein